MLAIKHTNMAVGDKFSDKGKFINYFGIKTASTGNFWTQSNQFMVTEKLHYEFIENLVDANVTIRKLDVEVN